uniref:NADH dehydrogenase subunit 4L n=1 Tax=Litostrophus scaber TaxID=2259356 RepID=UPI00286C3AC2|nr:NADH dehydrogenase subunit 4L [Litostrophus scaber]WKF19540.1 NADH dehydrogenase subunit 4L [Litostrophus scaber]
MMFLGLIMVIGGFGSLLLSYKHVLNMLLSLEFISAGMIFYMMLLILMGFSLGGLLMYFLGFVACEGALGLGVLINLIRCHGNEIFLSLNLVQC